jgi:hypothetical protein
MDCAGLAGLGGLRPLPGPSLLKEKQHRYKDNQKETRDHYSRADDHPLFPVFGFGRFLSQMFHPQVIGGLKDLHPGLGFSFFLLS